MVPTWYAGASALTLNLAFMAAFLAASKSLSSCTVEPLIVGFAFTTFPSLSTVISTTTLPSAWDEYFGGGSVKLPRPARLNDGTLPVPSPPPIRFPVRRDPLGSPWFPNFPVSPSPWSPPSLFCPGKSALGFTFFWGSAIFVSVFLFVVLASVTAETGVLVSTFFTSFFVARTRCPAPRYLIRPAAPPASHRRHALRNCSRPS